MQCSCGADAGENTRCNPCFALYMRHYRKTQREKRERRAYFKGVEDARLKAVKVFQNLGDCEMNGKAAAEIIKRLCFT